MGKFNEDLSMVIGVAESGPDRLKLPFVVTQDTLDLPLDFVKMNARAVHTLQRSNITTVGQLFDRLGEIPAMRNCGAGTVKEIKQNLAEILYYEMNEKQKKKFWKRFLELNDIQGIVSM